MRKYIVLFALAILLIGTLSGCVRFFENLLFDDVTPDRAGHEVIHDLTGLNLINHDLGDSTLLEQITLRAILGRDLAEVLIIRDGDLEEEDGHIFNDAWPIGVYYFSRRHETAVDSVLWSLEWDKESEFIEPDSVLTVGPVHADADEQTAMMAVLEEAADGFVFLHVYMAQNVPDSSDVIVLDIWLALGLFETQDGRTLAELSDHIGVDFEALITEFAGHLLLEGLDEQFEDAFHSDDEVPDRADYEIIYDLAGLNLIDHDLGDSTLLEHVTLRTFLGRDVAEVTIIRGGNMSEIDDGFILSADEDWAVGMFYSVRRHEAAVDSVIREMEQDKEYDFFEPDSVLTAGSVHASTDEQMAMMVMLEEDTDGFVFLYVYMAQNVPDSDDVVVLCIWLTLGFFEARDERIIAELSEHIGIDFQALITEFAGHLLPEEMF